MVFHLSAFRRGKMTGVDASIRKPSCYLGAPDDDQPVGKLLSSKGSLGKLDHWMLCGQIAKVGRVPQWITERYAPCRIRAFAMWMLAIAHLPASVPYSWHL